MATQDRFVTFESCFNFRDLGGYSGLHNRTVRWGRVYRSMTPSLMTEADVEKARGLGIRLVIDFRGDHYDSGPIGEFPASRIAAAPEFVRNLRQPPPEVVAFMALPPGEALTGLLDIYGPSFAKALLAVGERPGRNVLFHCRLGKDRTGVFAALLLKLLRVSDADVIEDYMLTATAEPQMKRLLAAAEDGLEAREPRVAREPVERRAMECVLQRLASQYGTAYNYFVSHGVEPHRLDALIEDLLEPSPGLLPADGLAAPLAVQTGS